MLSFLVRLNFDSAAGHVIALPTASAKQPERKKGSVEWLRPVT